MQATNTASGWMQNPEHVMLLQLISSGAFQAVQQMVVHKPELLGMKGWHGLTALHRACLCGNYDIALILLQAGADPNAPNDANETPMHYACKRGIPRVLSLLSQFGGSAVAVDSQRKTAVHHAADMGSVYMLHYLSVVEGVGFQDVDAKLQTPLHITAGFGHLEAFKYLLKNNRSDPSLQDCEGNTALHITAREGFGHMSYSLVSLMSCRTLHVKNKDGFTPLDLASQRDKPGHQELLPMLRELTERKDLSYRPKGPNLMWYCILLCPLLVYGLSALVAEALDNSYESVAPTLALAYLMYFMTKQQHRMRHVSRWANPFYAGLFGAGIFHTLLVFYVKVWPLVKEYSFYFFLAPAVTVLLLAVYLKLILMDPGSMPYNEQAYNPGLVREAFQNEKTMESFCVSCELLRPPKTKHCKLCNLCFRDMDHHCLFLLKCVARKNHRFFVILVTLALAAILFFLSSVVVFGRHQYSSHSSFWTVVGAVLNEEGWVASLTVLNIFSTFWGLSLLMYQLRVVANGHTSYFTPKYKGNLLTPMEKLMNVIYFFMGKKPFAAHPMVYEHV